MVPVASLDAAMLVAETAEMPLHNLGVLLFDPPEASGVDPFEAMRDMLAARLHRAPAFRRRLVQGRFGLGDLRWLEDPRFDLENHLLRARLPAPFGEAELTAFVGDYAASCLDRAKPLWEIVLVEGLASGELAAVAKIHHAAMDGLHLSALIADLFDRAPDAIRRVDADSAWQPEPEPGPLRLAFESARMLAQKPRKVWRAAGDVVRALSRSRAFRVEDQTTHDAPRFDVPRTPWSGALGVRRAVAFADVSLDDIRAIRTAFDCTVNDVVLAATTDTLRTWLLAHDALPTHALVANVPIAVKSESADDAGNSVSMLRVHLPVHEVDPVARLRRIREETHRGKRQHHARGANTYLRLADFVLGVTVPSLLTAVVGFYSRHRGGDHHPALWNLVVSNVPGPRDPLYCAGARLTKIYPLGPVQHGSGLNLTVMSTGQRLCLGVLGCPEKVPDLDAIGRRFVESIEVLLAHARSLPLPARP